MPAREATPRWFALTGVAFLSFVLSPFSSESCGLASAEVKTWIYGTERTCDRAHSALPSAPGPYSTCFGGQGNGGALGVLFNYGRVDSKKWSQRYYFDRPSTSRLRFQSPVHSDRAGCGRWVPWNAQAWLQSPTVHRVYSTPPTSPPILRDEKPASEDPVAAGKDEPARGTRGLPRDLRAGAW